MATFNPDQAIDFGVIMEVLGVNFSNSYGGQALPWVNPSAQGPVTSYQYSYGTINNPVVSGQLTNQTASNVQAALNLLADANSVSPGFSMSLYESGQGSGNINLNFYDTTAMTIVAEPLTAGTYNTDLSTATLVANNPTMVASSSLTFTFIPGTTQSLALAYSTGTTISEATTNGVTDVTTNSLGVGASLAVTAGTTTTGGVPGDTEAVSDSVTGSINAAWSESTSQSTNYSTTSTDQTNTTVTSTTTVNVNTATPNADGTYTYGTTTLIPGNTYVTYITVSTATYSSPISQNFQIYGPNSSTTLIYTGSTDGNGYYGGDLFATMVQTNANPMQGIENANHWGYSLLSGIDPSIFQYVTGNTDMVLYSGLVTASSVGSANATVVIQAVATSTSADNTGVTVSGSSDTVSISSSAPRANSTAMLDLELAALRLRSNNGVYFNAADSGVENALVSKYLAGNSAGFITLNGGYKDAAMLGNLNYDLTGFTHSNVTIGDGANKINIALTEEGNQFNLGNGNNTISLGGKGNNLFLGKGANYIEVTGGTGKNFIIDGGGPTALSINSANGFTQVSKWDQTQDTLHFGSNLNLSDVKVTFNYKDWSYNVYVKEKLVANLITVGGLSQSDPTTKITSSSAYAPTATATQTNQGFVTGLYADAFNRAPDAAGLSAWTNALSHGTTRAQVTQAFFTSSEYEAHHQTSSQYVSALYHDLLGRAADARAVDHIKAIDAGVSHAIVVNAMLNSAEFVQLVGSNHPA